MQSSECKSLKKWGESVRYFKNKENEIKNRYWKFIANRATTFSWTRISHDIIALWYATQKLLNVIVWIFCLR